MQIRHRLVERSRSNNNVRSWHVDGIYIYVFRKYVAASIARFVFSGAAVGTPSSFRRLIIVFPRLSENAFITRAVTPANDAVN